MLLVPVFVKSGPGTPARWALVLPTLIGIELKTNLSTHREGPLCLFQGQRTPQT